MGHCIYGVSTRYLGTRESRPDHEETANNINDSVRIVASQVPAKREAST